MGNIIDKLREKGYDTIPANFHSLIDIWKSWYDGDVKDFHTYKVFNGQSHVACRRYTMGMAKKVAEDWANLLMNEKVAITLEGDREQAFFDDVCSDNNFAVKINEMQELKSALGTTAYVVRTPSADIDEATGRASAIESLKIDYVTAPNIYPLSWENGKVRDCAFTNVTTVEGNKYLYLQIHHKGENGNYIIENSLYSYNNENLSSVDMNLVKGFENVVPVIETSSPKRQFVIDRLNIANNVDSALPMGIPAFANAIDCLKGVDIAYDSYVNEFVLGKKRIMAKPEAAKTIEGEPIFDVNDTVFYVLPEDAAGGSIITPIDMALRTAEHNAGLQDMLNALSSKCGFGENHYRFDNGSISTATQIISENSTLFRTIKKHEIILEDVLVEFCRIILRLGNAIFNMGLNEDVEISIDFDDSIIENKDVEFSRDLQMLDAKIMNDWEFRAKWMNEDAETAKAALPGLENMTDGKEEEIE